MSNDYLKYRFECDCNSEIPIDVEINDGDSGLVITLKNEVKNLRKRVSQYEQPISNVEIPGNLLKKQVI